ncbi:glycosyltransferase [Arthrobacter sp. 135MFCol5.1]|uniref:glycosyltransferase n=1 Tax=Arthrobacter sp. 135MFCol5.1 TaxID=1158050 RepID=UPI0003656395|nr:glycosyltransferase [Arthrobacter sp. 135MFCol5.1]
MPFDSSSFGIIALAAYKPDWDLFRAQLLSIQAQTHANFECLISADGGHAEVQEFVSRETNGDQRFKVLGFPDRLGFYGNFERVLEHVPGNAEWVALSDQDDSWYPSKIETLLPHLNDVSLVAGQARVVRRPGNHIVADSTYRKDVSLGSLIAQNQVTGSLCLFRRDLLDLALPFPRFAAITQVHDHWLAVCAKATGGALVVDDILQDYVQHAANVLGEAEARKSLFKSFEHLIALSRKYQGSASPLAVLKTANGMSFGWRRVMADSLRQRVKVTSPEFEAGISPFQSSHGWVQASKALILGLRRGDIAFSCFLEFLAGFPMELVRCGRSPWPSTWKSESTLLNKFRLKFSGKTVSNDRKQGLSVDTSSKAPAGGSITIVLPGFSKYPIGGYKVVYTYANHLAERGYQVTLIHALLLWGAKRRDVDVRRPIASLVSSFRPRQKPNWFQLDGRISVYTLPYLMPMMLPKTDFLVATEVQTAHVVNSAARRRKIPASYFIQHYEDWSAAPEFIDKTWKLPLRKVVIAPWLQEHMHSLGEECDLVPNGIDPEEFPAGPPLSERRFDICAMISDVPWKRADLVVEVINSFVERDSRVRAITFGTGTRPSGLHPDVVFIKNPSKEDIRYAYQSSKLYLCASDGEGWHLPPAEAMSSGCAVVSTDIGGVRAYAENGALFSAVGDAEGLRNNVDRLLNDLHFAQTLASRGLADMRENSPSKAAQKFEAVITNVR